MHYVKVHRSGTIYHFGWSRQDLRAALNEAASEILMRDRTFKWGRNQPQITFSKPIIECYPAFRRHLGMPNGSPPVEPFSIEYKTMRFQWTFVCKDIYYQHNLTLDDYGQIDDMVRCIRDIIYLDTRFLAPNHTRLMHMWGSN